MKILIMTSKISSFLLIIKSTTDALTLLTDAVVCTSFKEELVQCLITVIQILYKSYNTI